MRRATCVAYPYALVVSGGAPKLAWLTDYRPADSGYRGQRMSRHWSRPDWSAVFKTVSTIGADEVIRQWRHAPTRETIKRAARAFNRRRNTGVAS